MGHKGGDKWKVGMQIFPQVVGGNKCGDHIYLDVMAKPPLVQVWLEKPALIAGKQESTSNGLTKAQVLKASRKLLAEENQPPAKRTCGLRYVLPTSVQPAPPVSVPSD